MSHATTLKALAEITDTGLFERLATSVLRESNPIYEPLIHTGVNTDGKTVKGPIDGIVFVKGSQPTHMISVHHTTGDRRKLEKKWLYDPSTAKRRRSGRGQEVKGDILKTIDIYKNERKRTPDLVGTLVLTVTSDPSQELVRDAEAIARDAGITIDLWPASRIAHFLDTDSAGQRIRKKYLGIEQELLSHSLLNELSNKSLDENEALIFSGDKDHWISRGLDEEIEHSLKQSLSLVVGESGIGKSVACFRKLKNHIIGGGIGVVIPHAMLNSAMTLDQAIFLSLKNIHPALDQNSSHALTFSSINNPMIIVIEDVNRSGRPKELIEKVIAWAKNSDNKSEKNFHILCPVWPSNIELLDDQRKKEAEPYFVLAGKYNAIEGEHAVIQQAMFSGKDISRLSAQEISKALGYDPLLIALHDFCEPPDPTSVIEKYINNSLLKASADDNSICMASEYRAALRELSCCILRHKQFEVTWSKLKIWSEIDPDTSRAINFIAKKGSIIRCNTESDDQVILFRHDRIRDWLLADYIKTRMINGQLEKDVLSDPFYAELIGLALSDTGINENTLKIVYQDNPLSLFYALKWSSNIEADKKQRLLKEIKKWLSDKRNHSRARRHIRLNALYVLTETDSPEVPDIVKKFPENTINGQLARLRNGEVSGGVEVCMILEPGVGFSLRDAQIEHAKTKYGMPLIQMLNKFLYQDDIDKAIRSGALRLAGHIGDGFLAEGILECWLRDSNRDEHLDDYLWAFAQCWCEKSNEMLEPVMDAWANLPSVSDNSLPSPRDDLAAYNLRWAFRKWPPARAIDYFIHQADREELKWPITYMLHCMDHPKAVEFVVHEQANIRRKLDGSDSFSPFVSGAAWDWERSFESDDRIMSDSTKQLLLDLWKNKSNDKHVRVQAFLTWSSSKSSDDFDILCEEVDLKELKDYLLIERLKRGDKTAIPALIDKISQSQATYWWQYARYVWSDELTQALDASLEERRRYISHEFFAGIERDWILAELIYELPEKQAERILLKHWDHLRYCQKYVQAALYIATTDSLRAAKHAICESSNPEKMMEHLVMNYGIKTKGRSGIVNEKQIVALIPYLDYLSESYIFMLWGSCNDKGWFDLRKNHLDSRLSENYSRFLWDKDRFKEQLKDMISYDRNSPIEYCIDDYLKAGVLWEDIYEILLEWLDNDLSEEGLELVSAAVAYKGARMDVDALEKYENICKMANAIILDTKYEVKRRTLN